MKSLCRTNAKFEPSIKSKIIFLLSKLGTSRLVEDNFFQKYFIKDVLEILLTYCFQNDKILNKLFKTELGPSAETKAPKCPKQDH